MGVESIKGRVKEYQTAMDTAAVRGGPAMVTDAALYGLGEMGGVVNDVISHVASTAYNQLPDQVKQKIGDVGTAVGSAVQHVASQPMPGMREGTTVGQFVGDVAKNFGADRAVQFLKENPEMQQRLNAGLNATAFMPELGVTAKAAKPLEKAAGEWGRFAAENPEAGVLIGPKGIARLAEQNVPMPEPTPSTIYGHKQVEFSDLPAYDAFRKVASGPLSKTWPHEQLYTAYPELKDMPVKIGKSEMDPGDRALMAGVEKGGGSLEGRYDAFAKNIWLATSGVPARQNLAHEIQHAVQHHEGTMPRSFTEKLLDISNIDPFVKRIISNMGAPWEHEAYAINKSLGTGKTAKEIIQQNPSLTKWKKAWDESLGPINEEITREVTKKGEYKATDGQLNYWRNKIEQAYKNINENDLKSILSHSTSLNKKDIDNYVSNNWTLPR